MPKLYFDSLKEHLGDYFVSYSPPSGAAKFATLTLTIVVDPPPPFEAVLESEVLRWLRRYRVPIMASAWSPSDDMLLRWDGDTGFCVGWLDPASGEPKLSWDYRDLIPITDRWDAPGDWRTIYFDVLVRTEETVRENAAVYTRKLRTTNRLLKIVLVVWLVVVPAIIALLECFGPQWLGLLAVAVALTNAWHSFKRLWGVEKASRREEEEAAIKLTKDHYFYHCERNPKGFAALKVENFTEDAKARVAKEAATLLVKAS